MKEVTNPEGEPGPGTAEDFGAFGSTVTVKSELSIFDGPSYQVTHVKGQYLELLPTNQYQGSDGVNILFKINGSPGWYLDFNDTYMIVEARILKGKTPITNEMVAFENFGLATLFRDVSFTTSNQTKIEGENQQYSYRAYLYALLNASSANKQY